MELYKLQLSVSLIRYPQEKEEPRQPKRLEDVVREASQEEGGDPVRRDNEQIAGIGPARMLDHYLDRINAPARPPEMPEAQISFRRAYDIQADSLADAAGLLKKFEAIAEEIGVPAAFSLDVPQMVFPARGY